MEYLEEIKEHADLIREFDDPEQCNRCMVMEKRMGVGARCDIHKTPRGAKLTVKILKELFGGQINE